MEPVLYSLQAVLRGALILALSLTVFAQIPFSRDASGFPLDRKASPPQIAAPPDALIPHLPFEFRGIRIGDEMKGAERKFLAFKSTVAVLDARFVRLRWRQSDRHLH